MSKNIKQKNPIKKLTEIKSSVFSRSLQVAKFGLSAGLQYANTKIKNKSIDDFLIAQAENMTHELSQLKGSLMKAGQMLSMFGEYFLPPQANQMLKSLQSDSIAIDWTTIESYLKGYLSEDILRELSIEPEPIGTASLGQVHKAVIKSTGEIIALKIQYPHVDLAIDSDLSALKTLLKVSRLLPAGLDLSSVFEEIKIMLTQELDYIQEAETTRQYKALLQDDPRYIVPKVYPRYSGQKILATEYLEGFKADHPLIQTLSQNRRNQLATSFIDLYFKELFDWNLIQTDPHLGNYKVQIDPNGKSDRLVLLDFGATRKLNTSFMKNYQKMIKASIENNRELLYEACSNMGFFIKGDSEEYIKTFIDFCNETVEPFLSFTDPRNTQQHIKSDGTYHWKNTDLPGRVLKKALQFKNFELRAPPRDMIFLDRKTGGVFIFLSVLQAQINARKIIDPYLSRV